MLTHRQRAEPTGFELGSQRGQELPLIRRQVAGTNPVDTGGASALVALDPAPGDHQERRVTHEVEQVIEAP